MQLTDDYEPQWTARLEAVRQLEADLVSELARYAPAVEFQTFQQFVDTDEPTSEPLLGTTTETVLPMNGLLLMYGDGGAGKTTLSIDAAAHMGSGTPWLDIEIARPMKVAIIENEGPRGKFRQMLAEKLASWEGPSFGSNLSVLEEPWTQFTLQQEDHRMALAEHVTANEVDVVFMGPLVTLGMIGGGTPDEVSKFETYLGQTRQLASRPFAFWIVHHENKAGDVSGAWERVPDTLCHIQAAGNGHTRLVWQKARWSSENHGKSLELIWTEGRSFQVKDAPQRDPWTEMLEAFRKDDQWRTAKESGKLIEIAEEQAKKVLAELVRQGSMQFEKGPAGRHHTANCWRLSGALGGLAHLDAPDEQTPENGEVRWCAPPVRGAATSSAPTTGSAGAPIDVSAPQDKEDDGIPF